MNKRNFFSKAVSWLLITALVNPAAMSPAFARDTDIFLSTTSGVSVAEPNVMIVLDTSDSMNLFEDWREYPGAYDSHVEYLWNDLNVIGNGGAPQNTESGSTIASGVGQTVTSITRVGNVATVQYAAVHNYAVGWTVNVYNATDPLYNGSFTITGLPTTSRITYTMSATPAANAVAVGGTVLYASSRNPAPSSVYGFWGGNTPEERIALWNSAKTYANGTESAGVGDPGIRHLFRNYSDASWLYWTTTTINSIRLRSPSFNRFRGHVQTIGGTRAGINFGGTANDYRAYNKCNNSGNAPVADVPANTNATGVSTRIDPVDNVTPYGLTPSTIFAPSSAPRNSGRYKGERWVRWERFLDLQDGRFQSGDTTYGTVFSATNVGAFTIAGGSGTGNVGSSVSLRNDHAVNPLTAAAVRDSYPNAPGYGNTSNIGASGQPIRTRIDRNTAGSVQANDSRSGWTSPKADLGGWSFASLITGAPYTTAFPARNYANGVLAEVLDVYSITADTLTARPLAWRGNRDAPPSFAFTTGTPAYYDHGGGTGTKFSTTAMDMALGSGNGSSSFAAGQVVNISDGATFVTATISTVAGSPPRITLTTAALTTLSAAANALNVTSNLKLNTSGGGTVCTRTCAVDADPGVGGNQVPFADVKNNDGGGAARYYVKSGATCQSTGTSGSDCSTLPGACGAPAASGAYTTAVFAGCSWSGRQSVYVEGSGTYYYGGTCGAASTCSGGAGGASTCPGSRILTTTTFGASSYQASNHCAVSGTSNLTVNGTSMAGAVLNNATSGCGTQATQTAACPARPGGSPNPAGCFYVSSSSATAGCTQPTVAAATSTTDYAVFSLAGWDAVLVHDCTDDNGTNGNPGSGYAKNNTDVPFNAAWSATYNTGAASTAPYSNSGAAISGSQMDVYSVNYLNWTFGPKGPSSAPIGRKTRLQIAKDALSGIVASTNSVRFGLMVFNRTAACSASTGTIDPGTAVFTAPNSGFSTGQSISVVGAGASGANLNTTISAIAPNGTNPNDSDFTLAASAANPSTTGSMAIGGTTVTVASTAGFAVGLQIRVAGADPNNLPSGDLIANITSVLAGPPRLVLSDTANTAVAGAAVTRAQILTTMQSNPCSGAITSEGANVARVIKRMGSNATDLPDYNNRATLISAINAVTASARTPLTESVYEAYRYFSGRTPKWGTSTATATTGGSVTAGRDTTAICASAGAGTGCSAVGAYASPMLNNPNTTTPAGCQKNFIVLITDGGPEDDFSANADVRSLSWSGPLGIVAARTGLDANQANTATDQFEMVSPPAAPNTPFGPTDLAGTIFDGGYIWLDELTYFMANADLSPGARNFPADGGTDSITGRQSVNTYTIGFAGANSPVLQNAAIRGNGVYYTADNSAALSAAIISALAAITAWNPTVAAPTVPISALNRSENATDVYLAFFQPDTSSAWLGTVKKFQLSQYPQNGDATICGSGIGLCLTGQSRLTKAPPNESNVFNIETVEVDIITGISQSKVDDNASSFWAPNTVLDGSRPNEGGSGHQLVNNTPTLTPQTRKVYTFLTDSVALQDGNSGAVISLTNSVNAVHFSNPALISKCRLGDAAACVGAATMTAAQQETQINWIRGGDTGTTTACSDGLASTCTVWRAWPHADVQHSKPAIVTYMSLPSVVQYMYYVQNNGLLTAVDTATGIEKWSFMVEEALPKIQSMINDNAGQQIDVADGSPAIYTEETAGVVTKAWLFFGLRRGGRVYYAIDITSPDAPVFGWKVDANTTPAKRCVANGVCTAAPEFNELGQTWSTPFIGKVRANANPVLVFAGGYDPADDTQPPGVRSMGRAVYVIDAFDAALKQSWGVGQSGPFLGSGAASMLYSIPSDVTALNTDLDSQGFLDRLYVGDTWGNLWRFDIDSALVSNWNGKLLATLSSDILSGERRKILFPPAAVKQNTPYRFDAIYVGTGDREHPLCLTQNTVIPLATNSCTAFAPEDHMFMVIDQDYGLAAVNRPPIAVSDLYQRITTDLTTNTSNTILNTYKGWYRSYDNGEKSANAPTVFNQRLRFGTYAPLGQSGGACVPLGEGRLNEIDALTGDLVPINGSVSQASDRYYSTFITHGYISTGQLIVQGRNIYHIVVSDSRLQSVLVGSMGSATKIYWYLEPEQ